MTDSFLLVITPRKQPTGHFKSLNSAVLAFPTVTTLNLETLKVFLYTYIFSYKHLLHERSYLFLKRNTFHNLCLENSNNNLT
jgi:hypothetical protein